MPLGGLATAGMIIGGLGGVGKSIFGISQMNKAKQIKPEWAAYEKNKLAAPKFWSAIYIILNYLSSKHRHTRHFASKFTRSAILA